MHKNPRVIEIDLDAPSRMTPALGQVDRLLKQSLLETQSLQVVRHLLMRDTLDRAHSNGNGKLMAAIEMRDKHRVELPPAATDTPRQKKKNRLKDGRKSNPERIEAMQTYLQRHAGQDTSAIAKGLGWRDAQANKFLRLIGAIPQRQGHREPLRWFPKGHTLAKTAPAKPPKTRLKRMTRTEIQQKIQVFLGRHPEAYTREVAKAANRMPNSSFVTVLRSVARPVRPTKKTEPIQWVLAAS